MFYNANKIRILFFFLFIDTHIKNKLKTFIPIVSDYILLFMMNKNHNLTVEKFSKKENRAEEIQCLLPKKNNINNKFA